MGFFCLTLASNLVVDYSLSDSFWNKRPGISMLWLNNRYKQPYVPTFPEPIGPPQGDGWMSAVIWFALGAREIQPICSYLSYRTFSNCLKLLAWNHGSSSVLSQHTYPVVNELRKLRLVVLESLCAL